MSSFRNRRFLLKAMSLGLVFSVGEGIPIARAQLRAPDADPPTISFVKNPAPVPAFLAHDLDGNVISTAAWRGKVALVVFWATWCPPCREEIPDLIALQKQYGDRLQVIGISVDDGTPEEVKAFAVKTGINYPIVMATRNIITEYGGVPALPTMFVINPDERVVQKHVGLFPPEVFDTEIRALLGMPVDAKIETFEDTGQVFLANAANATELPGVDMSKLSAKEKHIALHRMNAESCNCGCKLTLAQCRINDTQCSVSLGLARQIVKEISRSASSPPASEKK
ncbi:MAG TPA: TlpA disulfide reductase family protein [Candidatus Acidoferrales bacterium]|jgi:thiol-disulfide isomerase/thioredoxin|nr:TlpA disulfide reductase family protein [Candidatus Acidoferrales bacterium]